MVEQAEFNKELLKNKRTLKGTPLYKYASRFAKYFALSMGCAHLTLLGITYYVGLSEEFLEDGQRQLAKRSRELGMYDVRSDDTELRIKDLQEEVQTTPGGSLLVDSGRYLKGLQERYLRKIPEADSNTSANSTAPKEGTTATAISGVSEAAK